jgi:CubicO group peptidase (beta-lactamase class C family)
VRSRGLLLSCTSWLAVALPAQTAPSAALPRDLPAVAAAYAAKVAASALFVSGRTLASVQQEELAADGQLERLIAPLLQFTVDDKEKTVTARVLAATATAAYVDGLGCTLLHGVDLPGLRARALAPTAIGADAAKLLFPRGDRVDDDAPAPDGVDLAAVRAAVDAAFVEAEGKPKVRTRAVVVVQGDRLLCERYAAGYDRTMRLPGWSMTKSLVAVLIGVRVAEGKLDMDAPLPVPEWRQQPDDPRAALRLDDLLRMQSGLRWSEDYADPTSAALRMLFLASDYGGEAARCELLFPPRTHFQYSSGTANLLCRILRTTFADDAAYFAFAHGVFERAGMHSMLIEPDPSGVLVGSSFGFATARDWARFGMLWRDLGTFAGERVLPAAWLQASLQPTATAPKGRFGRHIWLNAGSTGHPEDRPYPALPADVFEMSGHQGQTVAVLPAQRLVVVRLGCTKQGGFELSALLQRVAAACSGAKKD